MNRLRLLVSLASVAGAITAMAGCGAMNGKGSGEADEGSEPLRAGTWNLEVDALQSNSCPFEDEDVGVGENALIDLALIGDTVRITTGAGTEISYTLQGDRFSTEFDQLVEVEDPCYIRVSGEETGDIIGYEYFELSQEVHDALEGDCSAFDTTGFPCSYELLAHAEWVGD